ncbi:hypothetical protein [Falsihalocynthiibacter arcticus]|uniref:Uncharacterized protein n=1 Tax=Falsihalocynthiibacter arcticus TaxID=1579316 RepID=A0A126V0N8_9RHOB|nr:hypothetical protein [Falsihalocynthiibacter arcticus]AML51873.1 hypothetical protein RC74_11900 [Falsihalocynthiibacter arcticus]
MRDQSLEVFVRGTEASEREAVLRLWEMIEKTERTTLLWNIKKGPYPTLTDSIAVLAAQNASERAKKRVGRARTGPFHPSTSGAVNDGFYRK